MTNGMKSGAGSDPFADDTDEIEKNNTETTENDGETNPAAETESEPTSESQTESSETTPSSNTAPGPDPDDLDYILRRNGVKDERRMIQYFLREETEALEDEILRVMEDEFDTTVHLTDVREALVRVGAEHVDEVADELRDWGYRYYEK